MKLFSILEQQPGIYEWVQRLISLNYRVFIRTLRSEGFFCPGRSYLDVGCGTGFLKDFLADADYLGVDLNPEYISAAARKRGPSFMVGDALTIGTLTRRFDCVVCIGLFHHLDSDQARVALGQCASVLNRGGEIFILDALWPSEGKRIGRALRKSDNGLHVRTLEEWGLLFRERLDVSVLKPLSQWPLDYVFARARASISNTNRAEPALLAA